MNARRGVSILEVLFAMGIASIALLGVMAFMAVGARYVSVGATADATSRLLASADHEFRVRGLDATPDAWTEPARPGTGYCLDPFGLLAGAPAYFPGVQTPMTPGPRLRRVSLRGPSGPITGPVADRLFRADDDLLHDMPTDRTQPPMANFSGGRRQAEGKLSWFATVSVPAMLPGVPGQRVRVPCAMSLVVCSRRDPGAEDRMCDVTAIDSGQVTITPRAGRPVSDMAVRDGGYLLLLGRDASGDRMRWYRVTHAPRIDEAATSRDLSVSGSDWPCVAAATKASIVDGVVGVTERTIFLQVEMP